ncbi:MAG: hypothetical protein IJY04_04225, partial [Clostridia bacterium]|nr:hypothetical protein [Clostridia bacterium]
DTEALYLPDANIAIVVSEKGDTKINLNDMINANETDNERIRVAENLRAYSLDEASRWHGIASDFHFRLEEIYSRAMDFEKVNGFFEKILSEIQAL